MCKGKPEHQVAEDCLLHEVGVLAALLREAVEHIPKHRRGHVWGNDGKGGCYPKIPSCAKWTYAQNDGWCFVNDRECDCDIGRTRKKISDALEQCSVQDHV